MSDCSGKWDFPKSLPPCYSAAAPQSTPQVNTEFDQSEPSVPDTYPPELAPSFSKTAITAQDIAGMKVADMSSELASKSAYQLAIARHAKNIQDREEIGGLSELSWYISGMDAVAKFANTTMAGDGPTRKTVGETAVENLVTSIFGFLSMQEELKTLERALHAFESNPAMVSEEQIRDVQEAINAVKAIPSTRFGMDLEFEGWNRPMRANERLQELVDSFGPNFNQGKRQGDRYAVYEFKKYVCGSEYEAMLDEDPLCEREETRRELQKTRSDGEDKIRFTKMVNAGHNTTSLFEAGEYCRLFEVFLKTNQGYLLEEMTKALDSAHRSRQEPKISSIIEKGLDIAKSVLSRTDGAVVSSRGDIAATSEGTDTSVVIRQTRSTSEASQPDLHTASG